MPYYDIPFLSQDDEVRTIFDKYLKIIGNTELIYNIAIIYPWKMQVGYRFWQFPSINFHKPINISFYFLKDIIYFFNIFLVFSSKCQD